MAFSDRVRAFTFVWLGFLIAFGLMTPGRCAESAKKSQLERFEYRAEKMGVPVRIIFYTETEEKAERVSDEVYARFDQLNYILSDYFPDSEIVLACRNSGKSGDFVAVSNELYRVLAASRTFTDETDGAFDITVSPIVKLWRKSRIFKVLPPKEYLDAARQLVGNTNWELSPEKGVRILKKDVRFDVGGIAKGFAMDDVLTIFEKAGIRSVLIDAGGDVRLGAAPPNEKGWRIGISSLAKDGAADRYLLLENCGIATSGDTFRYVEINGVRYSHLIDPRTGEPLTRHKIVSVIAANGTTADALASAFSILSPERSLELAKKQKVELLILQSEKDGTSAFDGPHKTYQTDYFKRIKSEQRQPASK